MTSRSTDFAKGLRTFRICSANSLVGVRTKDVGRLDLAFFERSKRGSPNARVFPDPVGALQQISLPNIASGIVSI